jgi:REP element-mobilizing transposase RayT
MPHWELPGAAYSVTWRLADSLPAHVEQRLLDEKARGNEPLEQQLESELHRLHGACYLLNARAAGIVAEALQHFADTRYRLFAWCVMPNHVHVLVEPFDDIHLHDLLHSWKSYTAKQINKVLRRTGPVWAREYWDRIIRDHRDLGTTTNYIAANPLNAGLTAWPWVSPK